jgi:hypothetical protein
MQSIAGALRVRPTSQLNKDRRTGSQYSTKVVQYSSSRMQRSRRYMYVVLESSSLVKQLFCVEHLENKGLSGMHSWQLKENVV